MNILLEIQKLTLHLLGQKRIMIISTVSTFIGRLLKCKFRLMNLTGWFYWRLPRVNTDIKLVRYLRCAWFFMDGAHVDIGVIHHYFVSVPHFGSHYIWVIALFNTWSWLLLLLGWIWFELIVCRHFRIHFKFILTTTIYENINIEFELINLRI